MPRIVLDLDDDLYASIEQRAREQYRGVRDQILWELEHPARAEEHPARTVARIAAAVAAHAAGVKEQATVLRALLAERGTAPG